MRKILKDLLIRLPHNYKKSLKNNNIANLFQILAQELKEAELAKEEIRDSRNIKLASGITLDKLGENVQQKRHNRGDNAFRFLIRAKIISNLSSGTIDDIINILAIALNISPTEIELRENLDGELASVYLSIPLAPVSKLDFIGSKKDIGDKGISQKEILSLNIKEFLSFLEEILAGGVNAYTMLRGSFSLGDANLGLDKIYSKKEGFADYHDSKRIKGGFFGSWEP